MGNKQNHKSFEEVVSGASECLKNRLLRADGTLHYYNCFWRRIKKHMESQVIDSLNTDVCKEYLMHKYGNHDFSELLKTDHDAIKAVNVLIEYLETGTILPRKELVTFNGEIGRLMTEYLVYKTSLRLAKHTIDEYEQHVF